MLSHFTHEEQFQKKIAFPVREDQRNAWKKNMADLLQIDAGLKQEEVYAALRLRGFCKVWMHEHMHMEQLEFEFAALASPPDSRRGRRPDASRAGAGSHDAHLRRARAT